MNTIDIKDKSSLETAATTLKQGGIIIFPTDTVYGIGCGLNEQAISKLYQIKNRPFSKPTAILMSAKDIPNVLKTQYVKYPVFRQIVLKIGN